MAFFRIAFLASLVLGLVLVAGPARAQDGWAPSLLLKGGTLGIGPELDVRVPSTRFGVRVDIEGLGLSGHDLINWKIAHSEPAYAYDARLRYSGVVRLLNGGLTGDWYPFGGHFRLSAGLVINGNQADVHALPVGTLRVGTTTITGAVPGRTDSHIMFNAVAPVVGFGYSALVFGRMRVSLDAGAMVEGNPHLSGTFSGPLVMLPSLHEDAERERQLIQRRLNYPVYPVLMLGVGWQF